MNNITALGYAPAKTVQFGFKRVEPTRTPQEEKIFNIAQQFFQHVGAGDLNLTAEALSAVDLSVVDQAYVKAVDQALSDMNAYILYKEVGKELPDKWYPKLCPEPTIGELKEAEALLEKKAYQYVDVYLLQLENLKPSDPALKRGVKTLEGMKQIPLRPEGDNSPEAVAREQRYYRLRAAANLCLDGDGFYYKPVSCENTCPPPPEEKA